MAAHGGSEGSELDVCGVEETKTSSAASHEHSDIPGGPCGGHGDGELLHTAEEPLSPRKGLWASSKVKPEKQKLQLWLPHKQDFWPEREFSRR